MKSWKEEKLNKTLQGAETLHEDYLRPDYDGENYREAYKHAYRVFRVHLHSLYTQCCGPKGDYHLGIGTFEELATEAFTDALERFLDTVD